MKRSLLCLALITQGVFSFAQIGVYDGKPRYQIEARRAGNSIGNIVVEMYPTIAPKHVRNFDSLVSEHFYDTTAFHRVVPGFVIQGGDPNSRHGPRSSWGFGDPSQQTVPAEFNALSHVRGIFSAARSSNPNSATSQFFICVAAATSLDGQYSAYGRVTAGMDVADDIVSSPRDGNDNPNQKIEMFVTRLSDDTTEAVMPTLIQPADSATDITKNYIFKWNTLPGNQLFKIEVSKSPTFDTITFSKELSGTQIKINTLVLGNVRYYWRLTSNNGGFVSAPTPVRTFTTASVTGIDRTKDQGISLYPNPANDIIHIDLSESINEVFVLKIFNMNGQLIRTKNIQKGQSTIEINDLSEGLYFYTLQSEKESYSGKFSVMQ